MKIIKKFNFAMFKDVGKEAFLQIRERLRQLVPQKLATLKNGKLRTGSRRHLLYTSIPSFDKKYLRVRSCSVFEE